MKKETKTNTEEMITKAEWDEIYKDLIAEKSGKSEPVKSNYDSILT